VTDKKNPYVPLNRPALGDLMGLFDFKQNRKRRHNRHHPRKKQVCSNCCLPVFYCQMMGFQKNAADIAFKTG
jgi:hypothetical protein